MILCRWLTADNSRILGKSRMMDDLPVLRIIMMGHKFPLFNPKPNLTISPPNTYHYATHSKERPPMLSLSTTASMGNRELRPAQTQWITFVLGALEIFGGFRTMPESAGSEVVHFYFLIFLWATFETGIIIPFLSFSFLSPYLLQVDPHSEDGPQGLDCLPMLRPQWPVGGQSLWPKASV